MADIYSIESTYRAGARAAVAAIRELEKRATALGEPQKPGSEESIYSGFKQIGRMLGDASKPAMPGYKEGFFAALSEFMCEHFAFGDLSTAPNWKPSVLMDENELRELLCDEEYHLYKTASTAGLHPSGVQGVSLR